jgi:hypothetical protein
MLVLVPSLLAILAGCGGAPHRRTLGVGAEVRPAFGLTESDAALLWRPGVSRADRPSESSGALTPAAPVQAAREELTALHPRFLRLLIDWARLQPNPNRPPELEAPASGCARTIAPCSPYSGVREELEAIASQQRAPGGAAGFQVVIVIFGTPAWAASERSGCERVSLRAFSRTPSADGMVAYRRLIHDVVALGEKEGVALDWWAPWNEPNDPTFLVPQRSSCNPGAEALSPARYGELVRAMAAQLRAEGGPRHLLLGELNAYQSGTADRTSIAEFVRALPPDVACLADTWSIHAYASRGRYASARDPVGVLEASLDARGGCTRGARVWITEAGAGAPHPGDPRPASAADERAACLALAGQLSGWSHDSRVGAVFQYTFRDDPAFPVGLADAALSRTYATYRLWLAWLAAPAGGAATARAACA